MLSTFSSQSVSRTFRKILLNLAQQPLKSAWIRPGPPERDGKRNFPFVVRSASRSLPTVCCRYLSRPNTPNFPRDRPSTLCLSPCTSHPGSDDMVDNRFFSHPHHHSAPTVCGAGVRYSCCHKTVCCIFSRPTPCGCPFLFHGTICSDCFLVFGRHPLIIGMFGIGLRKISTRTDWRSFYQFGKQFTSGRIVVLSGLHPPI